MLIIALLFLVLRRLFFALCRLCRDHTLQLILGLEHLLHRSHLSLVVRLATSSDVYATTFAPQKVLYQVVHLVDPSDLPSFHLAACLAA